jgi:peptide/nickel transport system substrate-binding protein
MSDRLCCIAIAVVFQLVLATAPAHAATPKDTLVLAQTLDDLVTLDPADTYSYSLQELSANIYDRLMHYEADDLGRIVGGVAESWTVSPDAKTYVFKLRPNLKFQSGNPVTADDVAWSLQRVVLLNRTPAFMLTQLGWTKDNVLTLVQATDPRTLTFRTNVDFAPSLVLNLMSTLAASVIDKKAVLEHEKDSDFGNGWLKTHSAGSGAYNLVSWKPNESVTLEANPSYHLGAPHIKRVVIRHVPESATQRLLLEKGDIDVARTLSSDQLAPLAGNKSIRIESFPASTLFYLGMNLSGEHLKNPKVRQAIKKLIDYQGMVDTFLKGQFFVHQTFLPMGLLGAVAYNPWKLDVAGAKALLAEAGYADGFELELTSPNVPPWPDIAQSIQQTMGQAGIRVKIVQVDTKQARAVVRARKHQLSLATWAPDFFDPQSNAFPFATNDDDSDASKNTSMAWRMHWYVPDVTKQTAEAAREIDTAKRKSDYEALQKKVTDEGPYGWMFQNVNRVAMRSDVKGFRLGLFEDLNYYRTAAK